MPYKKREREVPDWVAAETDECLQETTVEAIVARGRAKQLGVLDRPTTDPCRRAFDAAEKTLDQVEFGRVRGRAACRKAAVALRKYNTAAECAAPSHRRPGLSGAKGRGVKR